MDLVLGICDEYVFDRMYASLFPRPNIGSVAQLATEYNAFKDVDVAGNLVRGVLEPSAGLESRNISLLWSEGRPLMSMLGAIRGANATMRVRSNQQYWLDIETLLSQAFSSRDNIVRQTISLFLITAIFGWLLYLLVASLSYVFVFDKSIFNHPRYLKNQMKLEITQAMRAIPTMSMLTVPWFLLELHGYSHLYPEIETPKGTSVLSTIPEMLQEFRTLSGLRTIILEILFFVMFTDFGIYLLHRWLHWPSVYKVLHKTHHKWLVCTPFASHAFHPVDGYVQSLPYHLFPMLFPLHKISYLLLFTFVNFWTVMIHDGEYLSNGPLINGAACHTIHHLYFNYNYGQFTTLWDRLGRSFRKPEKELTDPRFRKTKAAWHMQLEEVDRMIEVVDGKENDREYN